MIGASGLSHPIFDGEEDHNQDGEAHKDFEYGLAGLVPIRPRFPVRPHAAFSPCWRPPLEVTSGQEEQASTAESWLELRPDCRSANGSACASAMAWVARLVAVAR